MIDSQSQFFGGSSDVTVNSFRLGTYGSRLVRVRDSLFTADRTLTLPEGYTFTEGGPIFIISNGSSDNCTVKSSNNVTIGTVSSGSTGYLFLLDAYGNDGYGRWVIAGNGTSGEVGDQGDPSGFNYGNASLVTGLASDFGSSENMPEFSDGRNTNFGNATVATPIQPTL